MNRKGFVLLVMMWMSALAVSGADWPQWWGPNRDGISPESGLLDQWPAEGLKPLWEATLGEGYSSFAVVGDKVYTLYQRDEAQWAVCLNGETGKEVWKKRLEDRFKNYPGPRTTPTVDGERIYVMGAQGGLACLNRETGEKIWGYNIFEKFGGKNMKWGTAVSPLVVDDALVFHGGNENGPALLGVDKMTGEKRWHAKREDGSPVSGKMGYSSPILRTLAGKEQILFYDGFGLRGVDLESKRLLWEFPWETSYNVNAATPVVQGNHVFITSGYNRGCCLVEVTENEGSWEVHKRWQNKEMRSHFGSPIFYMGHIYGYDDAKAIVCLDWETGRVMWQQPGYRKGSLVMADEKFFVLGERGKLALVRPNPEKFDRVSEFQTPLGHRRCWTNPVVANGRLYARDEAKMFCYPVK